MLCVDKKLPIYTQKITIPYDLKSIIQNYRSNDPVSNESNVKAWHKVISSNSDEEAFHEIVKLSIDFCNKVTSKEYNCNMISYQCCNLWIMEYEKGDYTLSHNHYPADYSCIYYVDVDKESSPVIFEDQVEIIPENNMMVLFPGFINHKVLPTSSKRVAISLNMIKRFFM